MQVILLFSKNLSSSWNIVAPPENDYITRIKLMHIVFNIQKG